MRIIHYAIVIAIMFSACTATNKLSRNEIANTEKFAAEQYKILMKNTPDNVMPVHYNPQTNNFRTGKVEGWTSGFYPGSLWLIYKATKDPVIKAEAEKRLKIEEKIKYMTDNHDIGFMIFCSFGTAYDITKNEAYKDVILTAAESATKRYNSKMQSIQSWNKNEKFTAPVIIDNMMNLELLEWAAKNGGDHRYAQIARSHANTTLKTHFRADNSSYHVVDYDPATGTILKKMTHQGYADESAWARGQAWGLYGYTMMYRFTKNAVYLDQANKIASFILNHPNMPADKIPYWDFNAPDIPSAKRDASAGAIIASALLELAQYNPAKLKRKYIDNAAAMIQSLSNTYRSAPGANKGFLLQHSVGHLPKNSEVDVSLTYADYYYLEALDRYKKWVL